MLAGLDSKFEPLVTSVTTRIDPFSLNDLFAHLLSYEMCMEHHNTSLQVSSFSANNVSCPSQRGKYMGREEVVAKVGIKWGKNQAHLEIIWTKVGADQYVKSVARWGMLHSNAIIDLIIHIKLTKIGLPLQLQLLPILSIPTGILTQVPRIILRMILTNWWPEESIKARIKFRLQMVQVWIFTILVTLVYKLLSSPCN